MFEGTKRCTDYNLSQVKSKEFIYTWKINNFISLHPGVGKFISSSKVTDDKTVIWNLQLYADGIKECSQNYEDYLALNIACERQTPIGYPTYLLIMCIVDKNGAEHELYRVNTNNAFVKKLVSKAYVFNEENGVLPNGNLTLRFKSYFTTEVVPKFDKTKSTGTVYHVYNKSKLNLFVNFIRKNFTYFTNEIVHTPKLTSIMESKLNALQWIFNNEKFSDMKIVASGKEFYVYKGILATQSPVFAAMLEHDMRESKENVVHIEDFDHEVVQEMLRFIYAGIVSNLDGIARDLLVLADKYEIEQLKIMCEETLINDLSIDTLTSLLIFADKYGATMLKGSALEFFVFNVREIIQSPMYKANLNSLLPLLPKILENVVL